MALAATLSMVAVSCKSKDNGNDQNGGDDEDMSYVVSHMGFLA